MTPEEHEKYIDRLERNSQDAMDSWESDRRTVRWAYPLLLLIATATTLWLIWKTVEVVLS